MTDFERLAEQGPAKHVTEIEPIWFENIVPATRDMLDRIVEAPLLAACQMLYDKNVRTVLSSANAGDAMRGFAWITLDCSTMSDRNREVVDELGIEVSAIPLPEGGELLVGGLKLPVDHTTTIQELSDLAVAAAGKFDVQPMLWAVTCPLDELRAEGEEGMPDTELAARAVAAGNYYDAESRTVYINEEHFRKANPGK